MNLRTEDTPKMKLGDIDLTNPDHFVEAPPHEAFRLLRREAPLYWHEEKDGPGFWAVTKYHDLVAVSRDPRTFSSARRTALLREPASAEELLTQQMMMLNMDPPQHSKLRSLVNKAFTPRMVANLEPRIREQARAIVDKIAPRGECDFVATVAAELPLQVIAEMMGVPQADRHMLFDWSNRLIGFDDPEFSTSLEDGAVAAAEMYAYANDLAIERRKTPRDDIITALLSAEVDGQGLSELEFDIFFLLLSVAGNETTRNLISGGMIALMEHPAQRDELVADRSLLPGAVEEMLRWVSPVMHFRRTATRDTEIRGQPVREDDKIMLFYISANRDEEVFERAGVFDVRRSPNHHIAFGIGEHFCLGANLARMEIRIMFEELLRRLPDMRLAGPVRRLRSNFINGVKHIPVTFTPEKG